MHLVGENPLPVSGPHDGEVLGYVKSLITLRKEHATLRDGKQWTIGVGDDYFAYVRDDGGERVLTVFAKKGGTVEHSTIRR